MIKYTAEHIRVLEDIQAVRKRPGMYIGSTSAMGLHHLLNEVVDNSIDEAVAGFCNKIIVKLKTNGFVEITDNGRGIPIDVHKMYNRPALEIVLTKLHAGGKFDGKVYRTAGGLHGVGISVVNALSEKLIAIVKRDGKVYKQEFEYGKPVSDLEQTNENFEFEHGTKIIFKPDKEIFNNISFSFEIVSKRLRELAFLNSNVEIVLIDERINKKIVYKYEGGLKDFINFLCEGKHKIMEDALILEKKFDDILVSIAIQYTKNYGEDILSFVNNINTVEGGTHVIGFKRGLSRVFLRYIEKNMNTKVRVEGSDIRDGIVVILSIRMPNPQFEGQTKTKLGNENIKGIVERFVYKSLMDFLEVNKEIAKVLVERIMVAARAREAAKKARELVRRKSFIESTTLPGKLADCATKNIEESELFIVEGESAGGSAKQARDRMYQAILPLRGKILNVEKAKLINILKNTEIQAIISAIGTGVGDDFDIKKLRYGKIIIMTDADVDGAHIRTLLLTFFYRYMIKLIENGHIYIAKPPLYRIKSKNKVFYVYSDEEKERVVKNLNTYEIQRYKGLGEMNPQQLWETTMDKEKRNIIRIEIEDAIEADRIFSILMGEETEPRKRFIIEHAMEAKNIDV